MTMKPLSTLTLLSSFTQRNENKFFTKLSTDEKNRHLHYHFIFFLLSKH